MKRRKLAREYLATAIAVIGIMAGEWPVEAHASTVNDCRIRAANAFVARVNAHQTALNQCLKFGQYYGCEPEGDLYHLAREALENAILADSGPCETALLEGALLSDLAPPVCGGRLWFDYNPSSLNDCTFSILTLGDWTSCLDCQASDLGQKLHFELDLPYMVPESIDDRKCIRAASTAASRAQRSAIQEVISCAKRSEDPPGDCALDLTPDGKLARGRIAIEKRMARCRDENKVPGQLGPGSAALCTSANATPASLADCLARNVACQACMQLNAGLGTNQDCVAISGDHDCVPQPTKLAEGSFFVANRGDDTVSFFDRDGEPAFGTLASSTFPVGPSPVDVAVSQRANTIVVVNDGDDSVTTLRANTGEPVAGTVSESTVVIGAGPHAVAIDADREFAYVTNAGDDTVTFLDARSGRYAFGTLNASTFPVGDEPTGVALDEYYEEQTLYVLNAGDDTVTFLSARTGMPRFGTLAASTFPVGANAGAIAYREYGSYFQGGSHHYIESFMVTDFVGGAIRTFDLDTGAPAPVLLIDQTEMPFGPGVEDLTERNEIILATAPAAQQIVTWSENRDVEVVDVVGTPTDVEFGLGSAGKTPGLISEEPAIVSVGDADHVVMSPTETEVANLGASPSELSSVPNDGYFAWIYRSDTSQFYAAQSVVDENFEPVSSQIVALDETTLAVEQTIPTVAGTREIEFSATHDTIFALRRTNGEPYESGVTFLNATTGAPALGTLEASTIDCGCDYIDRIEIGETSNRLYMMCGDYIVYVNATTGACLGGSLATTGAEGTRLADMVASESDGTLLVSYGGVDRTIGCPYSELKGIYRLNLATPAYLGADLASATLSGTTSDCGMGRIRVDGLGKVYAAGRGVHVFDVATGGKVGGTVFYGGSGSAYFEVDVTNDVVHVYTGAIQYRKTSDLSWLNTDTDSSAELAFGAQEIVYGSGPWLLAVRDTLITRVKRSEPGFFDDRFELRGKIVPTGDDPSAIGVMPKHTFH